MKKMLSRFFIDKSYDEMVKSYNKSDAHYIAIIFCIYIITISLNLFIRRIYNLSFLALIPSMMIQVITVFAVIIKKKNLLASIGITKKNFIQSFFTGIFFSIVIVFALDSFNRIRELIQQGSILEILLSITFWFVFVSFSEEVVFRGYIQPRIYGYVKNDIIAVLIGGFLFALMHLPTVIIDHVLGISLFIFSISFIEWFFMFFLFHFILNSLYRKYNSIVAPFILHGFMNLSLINTTIFL
ncbi:MAG: CPBP family intramembrane metalloprotease [Defluviitaleaceae bacterium]|nr:CPBP family intramembrane metalloprotease [Defluviitaleaceae bacterium]MCL2276079.1 CPBP family intramembrane metalloprotease [Defluviitaleaceae bacterium]